MKKDTFRRSCDQSIKDWVHIASLTNLTPRHKITPAITPTLITRTPSGVKF